MKEEGRGGKYKEEQGKEAVAGGGENFLLNANSNNFPMKES